MGDDDDNDEEAMVEDMWLSNGFGGEMFAVVDDEVVRNPAWTRAVASETVSSVEERVMLCSVGWARRALMYFSGFR